MTAGAFPHVIHAMTSSDLDEVMAIEQTLPSPWNFPQLLEELNKKHAWHFVIRPPESGPVLGYIFGSIVADEAEILKIAVTAQLRCHGLGSLLLSHAFQHLQRHNAACCFLELRESNSSALAFYLENGFQQVGLRKSYYTNPTENAMIMRISVQPSLIEGD